MNMKGKLRVLSTAFLFSMLLSGCSSTTAQGAAEGAATGAVAGAVGGMMTALIFGGDVAEAGARGAVWGGSTGAVAGGIAGSQRNQAEIAQEQARRDAEIEKFRKEIGDDAFNGVVALAECKHDVAIANARVAAGSRNSDYALAGVWVEALTEADRQNDVEARALYPTIVKYDRKVKTDADAEARLRAALQKLGDIRAEHELPVVCPT